MEVIERYVNTNTKPKRRRSGSRAELYSALEAVLPFAQVEVASTADFVKTCPEVAKAEDAEYVRRGKHALELAEQLIARKSPDIRRQQRALKEVASDA